MPGRGGPQTLLWARKQQTQPGERACVKGNVCGACERMWGVWHLCLVHVSGVCARAHGSGGCMCVCTCACVSDVSVYISMCALCVVCTRVSVYVRVVCACVHVGVVCMHVCVIMCLVCGECVCAHVRACVWYVYTVYVHVCLAPSASRRATLIPHGGNLLLLHVANSSGLPWSPPPRRVWQEANPTRQRTPDSFPSPAGRSLSDRRRFPLHFKWGLEQGGRSRRQATVERKTTAGEGVLRALSASLTPFKQPAGGGGVSEPEERL